MTSPATAARFPALAPQQAPAPLPLRGPALSLGLTIGLLPLPVGEVSVLLSAWLLILPS